MKERHHGAVFFLSLNSLAYLYVYLHCYFSYIKMDKVSLLLEKSNSYTYVLDSISSHLLKILLLQLPFLSYVITFFLSAGSLTSALQHACSVSILNCPLMLCVLSGTELYLCFPGQQNFKELLCSLFLYFLIFCSQHIAPIICQSLTYLTPSFMPLFILISPSITMFPPHQFLYF